MKLYVTNEVRYYRKVPKFSDARKICCNLPKIQTKRPNLRSSLIWVCTVCPNLSVRKFRVITIVLVYFNAKYKTCKGCTRNTRNGTIEQRPPQLDECCFTISMSRLCQSKLRIIKTQQTNRWCRPSHFLRPVAKATQRTSMRSCYFNTLRGINLAISDKAGCISDVLTKWEII